MDLTSGTPGPISAPPKRRLRPALRIALALGILLLIVILMVVLVLPSDTKVVWLTPSQISGPKQSTVFARYKYKLAVLVWPLIHNYWHGHPSISVNTSLMTLSSTATEQTGLGAPSATNASGLRIWILSPTELASFQKRLKAIPGASPMGKTGVQTADGMQAQASMTLAGLTGSSLPATDTKQAQVKVRELEDLGIRAEVMDGAQPKVRLRPINLTVDVIPKVTSSSIKLTIGVTATELIVSEPGIPGVTRTNLSVACRVLVPNAGGLVMESRTAKDASGNTCLMIASPTAVDSRGNPVKL
jgi:hypothetical protein